MYRSLERYSGQFTLWILCFDSKTYQILAALNLVNARLISREEFDGKDSELIAAQKDRTLIEYYWTCTSSLPLYIFKKHSEIESLCYLDADIFFFSDPRPIFDALGQESIFIVPHDYDEKIFTRSRPAGLFNVGVVVFRHNETGLQCLRRWRTQCLGWCKHESEDGKFGDQGYLNDWPDQFRGVVVSTHPGIHAGPWNIGKYHLEFNNGNHLLLDGERLTCFHFHALKMICRNVALNPEGHVFMTRKISEHIYRPYILALGESLKQLRIAGHCVSLKLDFPIFSFLAKRFIRGTWSANVIHV